MNTQEEAFASIKEVRLPEFAVMNNKIEILKWVQNVLDFLMLQEEKNLYLKMQTMYAEVIMLLKMFCNGTKNCKLEEIIYLQQVEGLDVHNLEVLKNMAEILVQKNDITENYLIYSDNIELRVIDLTQIELATQEDKDYQTDYWATMFKTKTWEELKMLAKKNEYMEEAINTIFRMSADELVIKRCRDREDYYSDLRSYEKAVADAMSERDTAVAERDAAMAQNVKKDATIAEIMAENAKLRRQIKEK